MEDWTLIIWFLGGLFTDNLLGMLYAWKLGPDRAEKLVINSLLHEAVIKKIRRRWDFPTSTMVREIHASVKDEVSKTEAALATTRRELRGAIDAAKAEVVIPESKVDDIIKGLYNRLRPSLQKNMSAAVLEALKEFEAERDPETTGDLDDEIDMINIGDFLVDQGVDERIVAVMERKGPALARMWFMKNYPNEAMAVLGVPGE